MIVLVAVPLMVFQGFADDDGYVHEADGSYLGTMRVAGLGQLLGDVESSME